jgi:hypothetical protein
MNKTEAKRFVWRSIAASCRKWSTKVTMADIGRKARQKDVSKVKQVLLETAEAYERKLGEPAGAVSVHLEEKLSEVAAESPGPEDGPDSVPEISDQSRFGKEASAAGVDKQKARRR